MTEASFAIADSAHSRKRKLAESVESAFKRQKKSDEELFGVRLTALGSGFETREGSADVIPEPDDIDSRISRSETPVSVVGQRSQRFLKSSRLRTFGQRQTLNVAKRKLWNRQRPRRPERTPKSPLQKRSSRASMTRSSCQQNH
ncbi:hypothetical protein LB505_004050 [Fusarium chuoi]|nr:hypothetical protein LB505_004050 [Fusarium chuoi]